MKFSSFAVAALLSLSTYAAHAVTTPLPASTFPLNPAVGQEVFDATFPSNIIKGSRTFNPLVDTFDDLVQFRLNTTDFPDATAELGFSFTELRVKNVVNIDFSSGKGLIELYAQDGTLLFSDVPVPVSTKPYPADVLSFDLPTLTTRAFAIRFAGDVVGTSGGSFSYELAAVPVPEPQSYALALSGLALAGVFMNRRRNG